MQVTPREGACFRVLNTLLETGQMGLLDRKAIRLKNLLNCQGSEPKSLQNRQRSQLKSSHHR